MYFSIFPIACAFLPEQRNNKDFVLTGPIYFVLRN